MTTKKTGEVRDIHRTNIYFLLSLKGTVGILHNLIHDNLALMAVAQFKTIHPKLICEYTNAGASGIDIIGRDRLGNVRLVAEVKTTLPDQKGRIRGPQKAQVKKDLDRLKAHEDAEERYLVVLSTSTKKAIQKQLNADQEYVDVKIINAFDEELLETNVTTFAE